MRKISFVILAAFIASFTSCKKNDLNEITPHLSETSLRVLDHIDLVNGKNSLKSFWIINYESSDLADLEAVVNWQFSDFQQDEEKLTTQIFYLNASDYSDGEKAFSRIVEIKDSLDLKFGYCDLSYYNDTLQIAMKLVKKEEESLKNAEITHYDSHGKVIGTPGYVLGGLNRPEPTSMVNLATYNSTMISYFNLLNSVIDSYLQEFPKSPGVNYRWYDIREKNWTITSWYDENICENFWLLDYYHQDIQQGILNPNTQGNRDMYDGSNPECSNSWFYRTVEEKMIGKYAYSVPIIITPYTNTAANQAIINSVIAQPKYNDCYNRHWKKGCKIDDINAHLYMIRGIFYNKDYEIYHPIPTGYTYFDISHEGWNTEKIGPCGSVNPEGMWRLMPRTIARYAKKEWYQPDNQLQP